MRAWPKNLTLGVPDTVVVRIAANRYEDMLKGIDQLTKDIKQEEFKGESKIEITLTSDSGLELVKQHSDQQVVVKGQPHREWSWRVFPKATGKHFLNLLVQGVHGSAHYDLDPDAVEYEVAFNFWFWFWNGLQQNAITWMWAIVLPSVGFVLGRFFKKDAPTKT